jgi:hypothetical protein
MPSMRAMGPACCCCRDTLVFRESRVNGDASEIRLYEYTSPDLPRQDKLQHNTRPVVSNIYESGAGVPVWAEKKFYYFHLMHDRSGGGGSIVDTDSVVEWWDTKGSSSLTRQIAPNVGTIGTKTSFVGECIGVDTDDQKIYLAGRDYAAANTDFHIWRMDYAAGGQTDVLTVPMRSGLSPVIGPMLVHRPTQRLYFVVKQNYTTASSADVAWDIRYMDLVTLGETTIYSVQANGVGTPNTDEYIRLLNSVSFDIENEKIYWCEHYAATQREGKVRRANLDGSGVELLYQSADPYQVAFAHYSNQHKKVLHGDFHRTVVTPRLGVWLRDPDNWNDSKLLATNQTNVSANYFRNTQYPWCGYEVTGSAAVV